VDGKEGIQAERGLSRVRSIRSSQHNACQGDHGGEARKPWRVERTAGTSGGTEGIKRGKQDTVLYRNVKKWREKNWKSHVRGWCHSESRQGRRKNLGEKGKGTYPPMGLKSQKRREKGTRTKESVLPPP